MALDLLRLYGTEEEVSPALLLRAGPLEASLDRGALRTILWRGREVLRGVAFLVRCEGWTTPDAEISGLEIEQSGGRFRVRYDARVCHCGAELAYRVELEGHAEGRLIASATFRPRTDFSTNRTGFVVLHPLAGVAGEAVFVEHVDGRSEATALPTLISPSQPLTDLRAITHSPASGVTVTTRFKGDTFEMEDQRNWSDASFKTYSRPLRLPYPYLLRAGSTSSQEILLTVAETSAPTRVSARSRGTAEAPLELRLGGPTGLIAPRLGVGLPVELAAASLEVAEPLCAARLSILLARHSLNRGHGRTELRAVAALSQATGIPVMLEVVLTGADEPAAELARVAADATAARMRPVSLAVFPSVDERSFQPGEPRPPAPSLESIYEAARRIFPGLPLGGGTPAFFPELNRKRPPAGLLDFVSHGTCPIVHAADDRSVLETLETLPSIVRSARSIAGQAQLHLGPAALAARINPYGTAPAQNPENRRVPLAEVDPRQRGLFGAAFYLGYAAAVAKLGVSFLTLAAPVGPAGIAYSKQPFPQPFFDEKRRPAVFPAYFALAELGAAAGRALFAIGGGDPSRVAALAFLESGTPRLVLANLTSEALTVRVEGGPRRAEGWLLDQYSFERACFDWSGFGEDRRSLDLSLPITLLPYAVASIGGVQ